MLEASKNEFIVDIVQQLQGFGKLFDRSATEVEKKRELSRFFVATYLDRIRLHNVSLFFESSSTVAYVAREVARHLAGQVTPDEWGAPSIQIATNNVLAYLLFWLVARVPCNQFPLGEPAEGTYGSLHRDLIANLPPSSPDYRQLPLDAAAKRQIERLSAMPYTLTAMRRPSLLLGATSGLQLSRQKTIRFPEGVSEQRKEELLSQFERCFGPTVGSYHNKVFKRFMYATGLPLIIFLTAEKINRVIEVGQTHFVLDGELGWDELAGLIR